MSHRKRHDFPVTAALGYAFLIVVFGFAVWFIYGYTRSAVRLSDVESATTVRWDATSRLVHSIFEVENMERAVCLGDIGLWDDYEQALSRTQAYADSLALLMSDSVQRSRVDSLKMLLASKRENTLMLVDIIRADGATHAYEVRAERLLSGRDSVVVHSDMSRNREEKQVTYVINKTGKTFFNRLADVFRRSRSDTTTVSISTRPAGADTLRQAINVGDTVAKVLTGVGREEERMRRSRDSRIRERARVLQLTGIELGRRAEQLMESISRTERHWLHRAGEVDMARRTTTVVRMALLAVVAVLLAVVSLFFIWRDERRAALYRRRLEEARLHAENLLEQRERLLLTITHDIKSPVASISGFIELLRAQVSGGKAEAWLAGMRSSAAHLLQLVGSLLDYHLLEKGGITVRNVSFSPVALFTDCVESFRLRAEAKGLSLVLLFDDGADAPEGQSPSAVSLPSLAGDKSMESNDAISSRIYRADAFRIRQIAENLIGNALKYTFSGSVTVSVSVSDTSLRFSVADTGPGMTEADSQRIFHAFTRLSGTQDIEGVGLGLSITRELITLLSGSITLDTRLGQGSTFTVSLPVAEDLSSSRSCGHTVMLPHELSVVIIDDDPFQLQLACEIMRRLSDGRWKVSACSQTEELFVLLDERRFDIMFTDIEMPGMSGFELVERLRGRFAMPIVAMTAHDAIGDDEFLRAGFASHLSKPFSAESLSVVISQLVGCGDVSGTDAGGCHDGVPVADGSAGVYGRFAPLVAFADGDRDAELAILGQFRSSTADHLEQFRKALDDLADGSTVGMLAALGHKLVPVFTMIQSPVVPQLRFLSAIHKSEETSSEESYTDLSALCGDIIREMERILEELDGML